LLTKLILPHDDIPQYYLALKKYLAYLPVITKNPIAVFWRFVIHICQLLGVPINLNKCSQCQNPIEKPSGYSAETGQLICSACQKAMAVSYEFSPEASRIIMLLPVIGNYLNDLDITKENIKQINHFFLHYISQQFYKNIYLKSLQALE